MARLKPPDLTLYYYPACGYCRRVFRALDGLGLELELRDIHQDRNALEELVKARGRRTVPVLRINTNEGGAHWMPESLDIIDYLHRRFTGASEA